MRTESYSLTFVNEHLIGINVESAGALDEQDFQLRVPSGSDPVFYDLILSVRRLPMDGAECERPGDKWCYVCQGWFPKPATIHSLKNPPLPSLSQE